MKAILPRFLLLASLVAALPSQEVPETDRPLLEALEQALQTGLAGGEGIWPGYDLSQIPIAIYRPGSLSYLVQHPQPPEGFIEVACDLLSVPLYRGPHLPQMNANTSGDLAGAVTAFINANSMTEDRVASVTLILHESGHAFQAHAPDGGKGRWPLEDSSLVAEYPVTDAINNAWGRVEGKILQAALQAEDSDRQAELCAEFLAVRDHRQELLPAKMRRFEQHLELNEGLADYLSIKAQIIAGHDSQIMRGLLDSLARINVGGSGAARQRFYTSGSAQALLLDDCAGAWKQDLEETGSPLQKLMGQALNSAREVNAVQVARAWGLDECLVYEELASRARSAQLRSRFLDVLAAEGRKLIIDLSRAGGAAQMANYDPMNIHAIDADLRVHARMLQQTIPGGRISYERPVVQDLGRNWMICTLPADASLRIDGELLPPPEPGDSFADEAARISLQADGLSLQASAAWFLWEEDLLIIAPGAEEEPAAELARELLAAAREEAAMPVPAPPFERRDLRGQLQRHPDGRDRARALVFFSAAAWAKPSHRFVRELLANLGSDTSDLALLLVAIQCNRDELQQLLPGTPEGLGLVHDADSSLRELFGVGNLPAVLWIDAEGNIESKEAGYGAKRVEDLVQRLGEGQ